MTCLPLHPSGVNPLRKRWNEAWPTSVVQGRDIVLLHRFAGAQMDKIEEAVISLLPQIDILVVWGNAGFAAKKLAGGVPTVFISIGFRVELGLVQSLSHPGGNMTGIAAKAALEINGKRLQILKEIVPGLNRVGVIRDSDTRTWEFEWTALNQAARELGLTLVPPTSNRPTNSRRCLPI